VEAKELMVKEQEELEKAQEKRKKEFAEADAAEAKAKELRSSAKILSDRATFLAQHLKDTKVDIEMKRVRFRV
jgi:phage-related minor tail protein